MRFCVLSPSVRTIITFSTSGAPNAAPPGKGLLSDSVASPQVTPRVMLVLPVGCIPSIVPLSAAKPERTLGERLNGSKVQGIGARHGRIQGIVLGDPRLGVIRVIGLLAILDVAHPVCGAAPAGEAYPIRIGSRFSRIESNLCVERHD